MPEQIEVVSSVIPATPAQIYRAWLSGPEHAEMTGVGATFQPDGRFTAGDGYILGHTLERSEPSRFVQRWRTSEFPDEAPDSRLEVMLEATGRGTRVTIVHTELPDGQSANYAQGWEENYFEPMLSYFGAKAKAPRARKAAPPLQMKAKQAVAKRAPKKAPAGAAKKKKARR